MAKTEQGDKMENEDKTGEVGKNEDVDQMEYMDKTEHVT